jgi:hypothetical protein
MTREMLLESAELLAQPSGPAADEYSFVREAIAAEINDIMSKRDDLESLIGAGNIEMMYDNHRNHARFMESLFRNYRADVFVETVLWVFRAYRSHGFKLTYWPAQLDLWAALIKKNISGESFEQIYPFYKWMIINQPAFVKISDELKEAGTAHSLNNSD